MLKKLILLAALLFQLGLFSNAPAVADDPPFPECGPCPL